jgi:RNA polymerase sigma-70 factor (ECF subfamily)
MMNTAAKSKEPIVADDVLAEGATLGSTTAFAELVARHGDAVYTIARNMCMTPDDAERAVQEAFLTAWRELRSRPPNASFTTWLYRIATRTALAHGASGRRRSTSSLETFLPAFDRAGALIASNGRWPELEGRSTERVEIAAPLREVLERMDHRARAAFVLCDLLGLSADEAAVILDLPPRAVRRDAHRARLLLRGVIDRL